jgi:hypothetical protein
VRFKPFGFLNQSAKVIQTERSNFVTEVAAEIDGPTKVFGWRIAVVIITTVVRADWAKRWPSDHALRCLSY